MSTINKNSLSTILIKNFNFAPIEINTNGNDFVSLHKLESGTHVILEVYDRKGIGAENISMDIKETRERIFNSTSRDPIHMFKVYFFADSPPMEVINILKDAQFIDPISKRHLSCYIVDKQRKECLKLFPKYVKSNSIDLAIESLLNGEEIEKELVYNTNEIHQMVEKIKKESDENRLEFRGSNAGVSYVLIGINLFIYFIRYVLYQKIGKDYNFIFGVKENRLIIEGEYYRLIMPMFLHGSWTHVLLNCYSLYNLSIVERLYGHTKFIMIYFFAGLFGVAASFAFNINNSLGASGAVFGLLGALLYYGVEKPKQFSMYFKQGLILSLLINIGYGIQNKSIDNSAHFGGLAGGFLTAGFLMVEHKIGNYKNRIVYLVLTIVIFFALLYYGFLHNGNLYYY